MNYSDAEERVAQYLGSKEGIPRPRVVARGLMEELGITPQALFAEGRKTHTREQLLQTKAARLKALEGVCRQIIDGDYPDNVKDLVESVFGKDRN